MLNKIIYTILGFGIAFIFLPFRTHDTAQQSVISGVSTKNVETKKKSAPEFISTQISPTLTARAALAYDFESGTLLYSKNLDEKLPIASLTKLVTALVVVDNAKLDDEVVVQKWVTTAAGSVIGLVEGEKILVGDLLKGMLIPSANDAALALSTHAGGDTQSFVDQMNQKAKQLELQSTHFANPVGWDSDDNYSSTLDLKKIVEEFQKNPELMDIVATKEEIIFSTDQRNEHHLVTTNKLLLESEEVVGIKTGYTSKALGNLIIMTDRNNRKIITIVLGSENREEDTTKLLDWVFEAYRW